MNSLGLSLLSIGLLMSVQGGSAADRRTTLFTPEWVIEGGPTFEAFAKNVWNDVDRSLTSQKDGVPSNLKLLLALRVHLAIYLDRQDEARVAAGRIRALQGSNEEKAYAGLTTESLLEARKQTGGRPGSKDFNAAFLKEFSARLRGLPMNVTMGSLLLSQREKAVASSRENIIHELEKFSNAPGNYESPSLELADAWVRAHHNLTVLLPVKSELLQALDEAISSRR